MATVPRYETPDERERAAARRRLQRQRRQRVRELDAGTWPRRGAAKTTRPPAAGAGTDDDAVARVLRAAETDPRWDIPKNVRIMKYIGKGRRSWRRNMKRSATSIEGEFAFVSPGDLVHSNRWFVAEHPELFEPVEVPSDPVAARRLSIAAVVVAESGHKKVARAMAERKKLKMKNRLLPGKTSPRWGAWEV